MLSRQCWSDRTHKVTKEPKTQVTASSPGRLAHGAYPRRPRTRAEILAAASVESSCSHTLTTSQPASDNCLSVSRSRETLPSSFRAHQSLFVFGREPWSGHLCQKQPSTNTATRPLGRTMSTRLRALGPRGRSIRKRSPILWSALRRASSGRVSRRACDDIRALTSKPGGVITGESVVGVAPAESTPQACHPRAALGHDGEL